MLANVANVGAKYGGPTNMEVDIIVCANIEVLHGQPPYSSIYQVQNNHFNFPIHSFLQLGYPTFGVCERMISGHHFRF